MNQEQESPRLQAGEYVKLFWSRSEVRASEQKKCTPFAPNPQLRTIIPIDYHAYTASMQPQTNH